MMSKTKMMNEFINAVTSDELKEFVLTGKIVDKTTSYLQLIFCNNPNSHFEPTFYAGRIKPYLDLLENNKLSKSKLEKIKSKLSSYCKKNNLNEPNSYMGGFRIEFNDIFIENKTSTDFWEECKMLMLEHMPRINNIIK